MIVAAETADIIAGIVIALISASSAWGGLVYVRRQDKAKAAAVHEVSADAHTIDLIKALQAIQQKSIDRSNKDINQLKKQLEQAIEERRVDKETCDKAILDLHTRLVKMEAETEFWRKQAGDPAPQEI